MKALKCIRKAGGLDDYLLKTSSEKMRSQFGELLRSYIIKKKANPEWRVPYIPKSWKKPKRWNDNKEEQSAVLWKPSEIRNEDFTKYKFDVYDPNAPPTVDMPDEEQDAKIEEVVDVHDGFDTETRKIQRQMDDDNENSLKEMVDAARSLGIDEEEDQTKQKEQKKQKEPASKSKKSRSRQAFEKKMKKIEDRILEDGLKSDTQIITELKKNIMKLKGDKKLD